MAEDNKAAVEEQRLNKLRAELSNMGSIAEIDGYLEFKVRGGTRLQILMAMSPVNAAQAKTLIKNAKLAIDPEWKESANQNKSATLSKSDYESTRQDNEWK